MNDIVPDSKITSTAAIRMTLAINREEEAQLKAAFQAEEISSCRFRRRIYILSFQNYRTLHCRCTT